MVVLVFTSLIPGVNDLGSAPSQMMFPPIVSFLMLGTAAVLSIYTPWWRTSWSRARAGIAG